MSISAVTFIKDTFKGAFCLFESMASLLPYVDEMVIMDLGSTDGTQDALRAISMANTRIRTFVSQFTREDASAFADAANEAVSRAQYSDVLFWQADEIWHENLLERMASYFQEGHYDLSFWRYQLRDNFQRMKWFPHPVHRVGPKSDFMFVNDGMNTDRTWSAKLCSVYDGGWFTKWGQMPELEIPVKDMILDVSLVGGFRDNIPDRRRLHAPMWHEQPTIEGTPIPEWIERENGNPDWTKTESPFDIPKIMTRHVGRTVYKLDADILEALKADKTKELLS